MLMPTGPNVPFTWAHDRVRDALQRVIGMSTQDLSWEYGSLTEARDIANRDQMALREVGQRQCGQATSGIGSFGGGGGSSAPSGGAPQGGQTGGGGRTGGGAKRAAEEEDRRTRGEAEARTRPAWTAVGVTFRCAPNRRGAEHR